MSKKWFLVKAVMSVVIIGLLIAGGVAIHYLGWSRGYAAGQLTGEVEGLPLHPFAHRAIGRPGLLLTFGLFIFLALIVGKLMRLWMWHAAWGPMGWHGPWHWAGHWHSARHWHRGHGPHRVHGPWHPGAPGAPHGAPAPPWCWGEEKPPEQAAGDDQQ